MTISQVILSYVTWCLIECCIQIYFSPWNQSSPNRS